MTPRNHQHAIDAVIERLTPESVVTLHRPRGTVLVNNEVVARFTRGEEVRMEDYADTLWTHVEDLKAAQAGWPL